MHDFKLTTLAANIELYLYRTYGTVLLHTLPQQPLFSYRVYRKALNAKL
jgi:hypothetical protein